MSDDDLLPEHERVRAALADVPPASAGARDAAIARALVEFDRMHTAPNVVAFPQRRNWLRGVAAAAAVLLIGIVGVSALKGTSQNDSSAGEAKTAGTVPTDYVISEGGTAAESSADASAAPVAAPPTIATISGAAEALPQVDSPEQLSALAYAAPDQNAGTAVVIATARVSFAFECPLAEHQIVEREIVYQGTPAVLVRDTVSGVMQALDAKCNVLATSQP
jgi:negative regulator of sigma E activity